MSEVFVRVAPKAGFEPVNAGARTDPFTSFFGDLFAPQGEARLPGPGTVAVETAVKVESQAINLGTAIAGLFGVKPKKVQPSPGGTPPSGGGSPAGGTSGDAFRKPDKKVTGRDFLTAAKVAAVGAAATGAGLGINEAAKQLGGTLNDAADTTGKIIQNAAEGIGKGFDNVGRSVGDALSPILDPLGITDPNTQASIGKWLVIGGAVAIGLFAFIMVVKK